MKISMLLFFCSFITLIHPEGSESVLSEIQDFLENKVHLVDKGPITADGVTLEIKDEDLYLNNNNTGEYYAEKVFAVDLPDGRTMPFVFFPEDSPDSFGHSGGLYMYDKDGIWGIFTADMFKWDRMEFKFPPRSQYRDVSIFKGELTVLSEDAGGGYIRKFIPSQNNPFLSVTADKIKYKELKSAKFLVPLKNTDGKEHLYIVCDQDDEKHKYSVYRWIGFKRTPIYVGQIQRQTLSISVEE